jgi:hypothetical protein
MTRLPYDIWSRHLPDDRRKNFEDLVKNSTTVLERLRQLIDEELNALDGKEETESDFDSPAWAQKQAFRNGKRTGLKRVRQLLSFIPER